jgi:hypothetical protein
MRKIFRLINFINSILLAISAYRILKYISIKTDSIPITKSLYTAHGRQRKIPRFLIYGFSNFIHQLENLPFKYYIVSSYPYPMIMAEFESEDMAKSKIPDDLIYTKYYNQ